MKKRYVTAAFTALALACMLGGCSKKEEAVELEILLADDTLEGGAMAAAAERFNEAFKDKGIRVKINEVAYADLKTQLQNRAAVNELPALVKHVSFEEYLDYVHPLDETSLKQENFLLNGTRNGKFYAPTVNSTAVGMLINKTAFDNAGVSYPLTEEERWTWDEFEAAVKEVAAKDEKVTTGLVIDYSQQRINTVLYQFGMQYFDLQNPAKIIFRSEDTKKGIDYLLNMYKEGGISKASVGVGTENAQDVFKTGTVAAHLSGNWVMTDYTGNIKDFEWCPVLMPYEKEPVTSLGGNFLFAMEGSGQEEEAVQFLEWFYQPENFTQYCSDGNYLPGQKGIEPEYKVAGLDVFNMEINASGTQPVYDNEVNINYHPGETWGNALREAMGKAIAGEMDSDGVMDFVIKAMVENFSNVSE